MSKGIIFFFLFVVLLAFCAKSQNDSSFFVVNSVAIEGNAVTKDKIIFRELPFCIGDSILLADTAKVRENTENNLINTGLFHFADLFFCDSGKVLISVKERWYVWPGAFANIEGELGNVWLKNMNFSNVNYGVSFTHNNFRGRKERFRVNLQNGYSKKVDIVYNIPYIDKKQELGFFANAGFKLSHSMNYFLEDYQYLHFRSTSSFVSKNVYTNFGFSLRKGIYRTHKITFAFNYYGIDDSVFHYNRMISPKSKFAEYNINYFLKFDHRDYRDYPLRGWYTDVEINCGVQTADNVLNVSDLYLKSTSRKYAKLYNRLYWTSGLILFHRFDESSYFVDCSALGVGNDYVRGYDHYLVPTNDFFVQKNNLKFEILPRKYIQTPKLRYKKFKNPPINIFVNAICDWGYAGKLSVDLPSTMSTNYYLNETFYFSYGVGFDFITYYDKVFRIDFCRNKIGENGLFLHFVAPI